MRNFELKQETSNSEEKKISKKRKKLLRHTKCRAVCTSTPRKSRSYYDKHRPLEQALKSTPTPDALNNNHIEVVAMKTEPGEKCYAETPLSTHVTISDIATTPFDKKCRRQSRRLSRICYAGIKPNNYNTGSAESFEPHKMSQTFKVKRYTRTSFYLRGNMFAHARTPTQMIVRELNRLKAQKQRRERFNKQREITSSGSPVDRNEKNSDENMKKLVTTQELLTFDNNMKKELKCDKDENDNHEDDWVDIDMGNSAEFERLLHATRSQAPFDVKKITLEENSQRNSSNSTWSTISNAHSQCIENGVVVSECNGDMNKAMNKPKPQLKATTPHSHATSNSSAHLSRTIYGGSVIFNRRIPNLSSTYVRKSSIYIKNKDSSTTGVNDIILVTDQTITIADLARMWKQMNISARTAICIAILASLSSIYMFMSNLKN